MNPKALLVRKVCNGKSNLLGNDKNAIVVLQGPASNGHKHKEEKSPMTPNIPQCNAGMICKVGSIQSLLAEPRVQTLGEDR